MYKAFTKKTDKKETTKPQSKAMPVSKKKKKKAVK